MLIPEIMRPRLRPIYTWLVCLSISGAVASTFVLAVSFKGSPQRHRPAQERVVDTPLFESELHPQEIMRFSENQMLLTISSGTTHITGDLIIDGRIIQSRARD